MKKTQTKKTKSKKATRPSRRRTSSYPTHYLALVLAAVLLIEGMIMGMTTTADWNDGIDLLDVSSGFEQTVNDTAVVFEPIVEVVFVVNQFYNSATTEMTVLLDMSGSGNPIDIAFSGVNEFYHLASIEMTDILDASKTNLWPARISGISITTE